uniref:Uncharacterized protein n=1 Tax=Anopheles dirus TaxID=7168 RepID=A0A182NWT4_9DIPT
AHQIALCEFLYVARQKRIQRKVNEAKHTQCEFGILFLRPLFVCASLHLGSLTSSIPDCHRRELVKYIVAVYGHGAVLPPYALHSHAE